MLTEKVIVQVMHRIRRTLAPFSRRYRVWLGNPELASKSKIRGGSVKEIKPAWWAPDAGDVLVLHTSTGNQPSLEHILVMVEDSLYDALPYEGGDLVFLVAVYTSAWNDRTPKEKREWARKNAAKLPKGLKNLPRRKFARKSAKSIAKKRERSYPLSHGKEGKNFR